MNSEPMTANDMKIDLRNMLVDSLTEKNEDAGDVGGTGL